MLWSWRIEHRAVLGTAGLLALLLTVSVVPDALGQLTPDDIAGLQQQADEEGWTFDVGENDATAYPLEQLCGMVEPEGWWEGATFDDSQPEDGLPAVFDWRTLNGVTPIKDQGGCGSCWAFATVGALECSIRIKDCVVTDLSEQWLLSCNRSGWGCGGGWFAHNYHQWMTDACGGTGAVLESAFPYVGYEAPCACPYPHPYRINAWAYIGSGPGLPSVDAIKSAIMNYGPVSAAVHVNSAFQAYRGGIFNACTNSAVNHAVVLVGWDDTQGGGVWILRNSWGTGWGENGYMRIAYGCSNVGFAACYVNYGVLPAAPSELTPVNVWDTKLDVRWRDNSSNECGFRVLASLDGANYTPVAEVAANTQTCRVTGLLPSTRYRLRVVAFNACGTSPSSNTVVVTTAPAAPTNLAAANVWDRIIDLKWRDQSPDESGFRVYQSTDGQNFQKVGDAGANAQSFRVQDLTPSTHYWFRVLAWNGNGTSDVAEVLEVTTAPAAPSNLVAANVWAQAIDLNWRDNSPDESGFRIFISTDGTNFQRIGETGANAQSFRARNLQPNTRYWFGLRAWNGNGTSGYSNIIVVRTRPS